MFALHSKVSNIKEGVLRDENQLIFFPCYKNPSYFLSIPLYLICLGKWLAQDIPVTSGLDLDNVGTVIVSLCQRRRHRSHSGLWRTAVVRSIGRDQQMTHNHNILQNMIPYSVAEINRWYLNRNRLQATFIALTTEGCISDPQKGTVSQCIKWSATQFLCGGLKCREWKWMSVVCL